MELENIDSLNLYIDKEFIHDETINTKRVPLDRDLDIGEAAYFRDECKNKIVKHGDNEYMFYRFDGIQTHIEDYDSDYSIEDIVEKINSNFNYDLEYASERVDLIDELIKENEWVYDLLSSNRVIQKEQKKKNSFLAENQALDKQFQRIVDYILHPKFNDEDMKDYFENLQKNYRFLQTKKEKTEKEAQELISNREEIDLFNQKIMTNSAIQRNRLRESYGEDIVELEGTSTVLKPTEFTTEKSKVEYVGRDIDIDEGYWERMGFNEEAIKFRKEVIQDYEEALTALSQQLGHGQEINERKKTEKKTIKKLGDLEYTDDNGETKVITAKRRFEGLKRMYSELKSDYYNAKEILSVPVFFTQMTPTATKYNFNTDTWYINEEGKEIKVSRNTVLFSNPNTYKGLIRNYYDLKDKYKNDFKDDMWAILATFEELVSNTRLTNEERFVLDEIMSDKTRKEIVDSFFSKFDKKVSLYSLSRWVNHSIPNKLLETYLFSIDSWLYTYKLKGKFKKCSKCEEVKLISNDRYFRKHPQGRDGFQPMCRKCERFTKTPNSTP